MSEIKNTIKNALHYGSVTIQSYRHSASKTVEIYHPSQEAIKAIEKALNNANSLENEIIKQVEYSNKNSKYDNFEFAYFTIPKAEIHKKKIIFNQMFIIAPKMVLRPLILRTVSQLQIYLAKTRNTHHLSILRSFFVRASKLTDCPIVDKIGSKIVLNCPHCKETLINYKDKSGYYCAKHKYKAYAFTP